MSKSKSVIVRKSHWQKAIKIAKDKYDVAVYLDRKAFGSSSNMWSVALGQSITIGADTDGNHHLILMGLAHELGHCISARRGSKTNFHSYMLYRFNAKLNKRQASRYIE
jgi:hypothetical protein